MKKRTFHKQKKKPDAKQIVPQLARQLDAHKFEHMQTAFTKTLGASRAVDRRLTSNRRLGGLRGRLDEINRLDGLDGRVEPSVKARRPPWETLPADYGCKSLLQVLSTSTISQYKFIYREMPIHNKKQLRKP